MKQISSLTNRFNANKPVQLFFLFMLLQLFAVAQQPGNALQFNGTNNYVSLPDPLAVAATLPTNQGITIAYWFKGDNYTSAVRIQTTTGFIICGRAGQHNISTDGGSTNGVTIPVSVMDGKWHHIAMTWQKNTVNGFKSYVDGEVVYQRNSDNVNLPVLTGGAKLGVSNVSTEYTNGALDEVRIYSAALSQAQLQADMVSPATVLSGNLLAHYHFNQGTASVANPGVTNLRDTSGKGYHGTLTNFPLTGSVGNWIESYAMVTPKATAATAITATGFAANWSAPAVGVVNGYYLEVSTNSSFVGLTGSTPISLTGNSQIISGLAQGKYYYRVRANKTTLNNQGAFSNTMSVTVPYTGAGNALDFDGSNDYVNIPTNPASSLNSMTIEAWFLCRSTTAWQRVFDFGSGGGTKYFLFTPFAGTTGGPSTSYPYFQIYNGATTEQWLVGTKQLTVGKWYHVAITINNATTTGKMYINGELVATNTAMTLKPSTLGATTQNWIGRSQYPSDPYFNGKIDEFRIWNTERTQADIIAGMKAPVATTATGLVSYYKFDNGVSGTNNIGESVIRDAKDTTKTADLINFAANGATSNWTESYAMAIATGVSTTDVTTTGFTANWTAPLNGQVNNYLIDVSLSPDFSSVISGSPFSVTGVNTTKVFTGLSSNTNYYYRIRSDYTLLGGQGAMSSIVQTRTVNALSPPGNCLAFNGTNNSLTVPNFPMTYYNNFTMQAWVNFAAFGVNQGIYAYGFDNASVGDGANLIILPSGEIMINLAAVYTKTTGVFLETNKWYHIALTRLENQNSIYVNGVMVYSENKGMYVPTSFNIGSHSGVRFFNGKMDEFRFYNKALTATEISADMRDTISVSPNNLVVYYNFDQGTAAANNTGMTVVTDRSNNTLYNGTLVNFGLTGTTGNYVASYALASPVANSATVITTTGFNANWSAPKFGTVTNYILDVSTTTDFTAPITGSPFTIAGTTFTQAITGLKQGTYYYRVRANNATFNNQGGYSNTIAALVNYTPPGNALYFDGVNDFVRADNNFYYAPQTFTLEAWFRTTAAKGGIIGFNSGSGGQYDRHLYFNNNGRIYFGVFPGAIRTVASPLTYNDGRYHHVAGTYSQVNGLRLYVDGQLVAEDKNVPYAEVYSGRWHIGNFTNWSNGGNAFEGQIDEARIWHVERTAEQIRLGMTTPVAGNSTGLMYYYNFDQGVSEANNKTTNIITNLATAGTEMVMYNFTLTGSTSNWVESYAMARPRVLPATAITATGFTANWLAPLHGVVNNYLVDVSSTPDFDGLIATPFNAGLATSYALTNLKPGRYYYRIRANKTLLNQQGAPSDTVIVDVPYSPPGNALAFDGVNDWAHGVPQIGDFGTSNFTVEYWLKTNDNNAYHITNRSGCGGGSFWSIAHGILGQGNSQMYIEINNGGSYPIVMTPILDKPINDGRWHHIALVRDGVKASFYIDGELISTVTSNGVANVDNTGYFHLANSPCGSIMAGSMDEVRLWNVAKTQAQLKAAMYGTVDPNLSNLTAYYQFDQGVGGASNYNQTKIWDSKPTFPNHLTMLGFQMEGLNTNFVESYAMVVPKMLEPTNITPSGFTLNWVTPTVGVVNNYLLDVSLSPGFTAPISGSPFNVDASATSYVLSGLSSSTFYCRLRANKSGIVGGEGGVSEVKTVRLEFVQPGNALQFNGNNNYAVISKNVTNNFTVEYWVRTTQTGPTGVTAFYQGRGIVDNESSTSSDFGTSLIGNKLAFGVGETTIQSITSINTGQWYHVAVTRNATTGLMRLFINGTQEVSFTGPTGALTTNNQITLGCLNSVRGNSSYSFNGAIDELRIWNTDRTITDIGQYYLDTVDRNTTGLVDYYRMDQGLGGGNNNGLITLTDISGADNGGILSNFTLTGTASNWVNSYSLSVNSPSGLTATSTQCGKIDLNWQLGSAQPSGNCDVSVYCSQSDFKQYVYADDALIAILPFTTTSTSFNLNQIYRGVRLIRGINYGFKVITVYVPPLFNYTKFSSPSNIATGSFKPNPSVPAGFSATRNKCDATIDLGWTWTDANPTNGFYVERSLDSTMTGLTLVTTAGNARSYTDISLQRGQKYYYRISARNDCYNASVPDSMWSGVSDTMAAVFGVSPSVPARPSNVSLFADSITNVITVKWKDNSDNEDKFTIERIALGGGSVSFETNPNDTVYSDELAASCVTYNYIVKANSGCSVNGNPGIGVNQTRLTPNLNNTFEDNTIYELHGSKGYYPDRVELKWSNRNSPQLSNIRIYRKIANSNNDSIIIASVLAGNGLYIDNTTVAGVLYIYYLIGETQCAGVTRYSNMTSDIGFRSPSGVVNGRISYQGGFTVKDVRVLAQNTTNNKGGSVYMDGINDYLKIDHNTTQELNTNNALTIETWFRPQGQSNLLLLHKKDSMGGIVLGYTASTDQLYFKVLNALDSQTVTVTNPFTSFTSYNQISVVYATDSIRIYMNGLQVLSQKTTLAFIGNPSDPFYIGGSPLLNTYSKGMIDELRIWKIAKSRLEIVADFNRMVSNNNANLLLYLNFDDRFPGLQETYDQSNLNLVFNENHASFFNGAVYSDSIPTPSQLALAGYTDEKGNFTVTNVRYIGSGQNYTIVPTLDIHEFLPNNKVIFVGDGSQSINNVDFIDNSSFDFTGTVTFAGTTCPAAGANVLIDGQYAILNDQLVTVNDSGKFAVRVPIGNHYVELNQNQHQFSEGRFPAKGTYNFAGPTVVQFKDSTLVKVVGRVAGGNRELNKVQGLGRTKNNIGKAQFTFNSVGQLGITGCSNKSIVTNDSTGEFVAYLYPLRYNINGLKLVNNIDPSLLIKPELNNPNVLDLTTIPPPTLVTDTLVTPEFTRVDSTTFHVALNFRYYETPSIYLTKELTPFNDLTNDFIGDTSIKITDSVKISLKNSPFIYPVFTQSKTYTGVVKVVEQYINIDKLSTDTNRLDLVPVAGRLKIFNNCAVADDYIYDVTITDGIYPYSFSAGFPNELVNSVFPQYSFTNTIEILFIPDIGTTVNYYPNQGDLNNQLFRGYVLGTKPGGTNFTTNGPSLVDFVLRDPPGSASSATWTSGRSQTNVESWSLNTSIGTSISNTTDLGAKSTMFVGAGAGIGAFAFTGKMIETETKLDITNGIRFNMNINSEGELVTTTTNSTSISTGADPGSVGSGADIYYGKATNIIFGNADAIELIDTARCRIIEGVTGVPACYGPVYNGYQVGKKLGYFIAPGNVTTTFAYTQDEIINLIIPDLEKLRNQLFTKNILNKYGALKYQAVFNNSGDPDYARKFGANNDDPIWGALRSTRTPFVRELSDSLGLSYRFRGNTPQEVDSVRFYNDQIRLWKNAIARNEEAKYRTVNNSSATPIVGGSNISLGKAAVSHEFTTQTDRTYTESMEIQIGRDWSLTTGFDLFGLGQELTAALTFDMTKGSSKSSTTSITNTYAYTLQDGDDGDLISVDVVDPKLGGSHVFKLKAGRTSCPYEGQQRAMFFDPSNDTITSTTLLTNGFEIQAATAKNDVPKISVQQRNSYNIPANDAAVFVLQLGNLSEGRQDRTYSLRVDQTTNPFGAELKIDGLDPNKDFDVPYGATVQKTLTVRRGPAQYDYDNIRIILKSACDDDIFDTVSISARFLPTCTKAELKSPGDRWILNNSYKDTLPVVIGDYNYNWGGFKALHLQYKPGGTNTWYTEKSYYKDSIDITKKIPVGESNIFYPFNFKNLPDGNYELRVLTECNAPGYPNTLIVSQVMQGLADRVNPSPFGTPSPADGILSPSDDISVQFNEVIEQSTLSLSNFEVKGVLNKSDLKSNTSLYFDGDNDYLEVAQGLNFQLKPFTIEFWHKRGALGNQVLLSQGADSNASFDIGFTADNKFYLRVAGETVVANLPLIDTTIYNFFGVSYNSATQTADLFINEQVVNIGNNRIFNPYDGAGKFYMGKSAVGSPKFMKGNLYEVRVWNTARTLTEANQTKSKLLGGNEAGLLGNWRMDEATGNYAKDYARFRHATIVNAQWFIFPMGKSYTFDGTGDFITIPTQHFGISKEMDFTIEFWFKGTNGNNIGLLSNGTGLANATNPTLKWSIETDAVGRIIVKHNGVVFQATNTSFFDGNWHHLALVLRRNSSLTCYVDANQQNQIPSGNIEQFGGLKLWFGAKGWNNNGNLQYDSTSNHFTGQLDDLRFWNTSRLIEQITRDKNSRLMGDEAGLVLYVPFESYQDVQGVPILNPSIRDFTSLTRTLTSFGDAAGSDLSPTLKLPRGAQSINFSYGVNGDKIIITPTTANEYIENVTLDITVKNINDKNGNTMQSPKTWIAYVDKNQVKWQDDSRTFDKAPGAALSFEATIINSGGALKSFTIGNLPTWLKASTTNATISPNSKVAVTFTVDPNMNIGRYEQDLTLLTDFGYPAKLLVKVNVLATPPNWKVVQGTFTKSMSIVGQVRINNVISANTDDMLGAFVNNVCRGVAKVKYYDQLDKYIVFMDVYGNTDNEPMEFRIWNSATGKTHIQVTPQLNFVSNSLVGSVNVPQIFNALDKVTQRIPLGAGWNWISFSLLSTDSNNLNQLFGGLNSVNGNQVKNNTQMAVYDPVNGWSGSLANLGAGIKPESGYQMLVTAADTIEIKGIEANPGIRTLNLNTGWNYLGFVSQRNLSTNEALAGWTATQNELIKGQTNFAIYDTVLGWVGSLAALKPGEGYLFRSAKTGSFNYPRSAMFGKQAEQPALVSNYWNYNPRRFTTNMNIIGKVSACSNVANQQQLSLGAFVNNELRGFAVPQTTQQSEMAYFLSVSGNENEVVNFKLLDETTGSVYDLPQNISYKADALKGTLSNPVLYSSDAPCVPNKGSVNTNFTKVYPIPFADELTVEFGILKASTIHIRVLDISGKQVGIIASQSFDSGNYQLSWKGEGLPGGVYIVEVEGVNNISRYKVVKLN